MPGENRARDQRPITAMPPTKAEPPSAHTPSNPSALQDKTRLTPHDTAAHASASLLSSASALDEKRARHQSHAPELAAATALAQLAPQRQLSTCGVNLSPEQRRPRNCARKQSWDTLRAQNASAQQYLCEKSRKRAEHKPSSSCLRTRQNDSSTPFGNTFQLFVLILRRKDSGWWSCHFWVHANLRSEVRSGVFGPKRVRTHFFSS